MAFPQVQPIARFSWYGSIPTSLSTLFKKPVLHDNAFCSRK